MNLFSGAEVVFFISDIFYKHWQTKLQKLSILFSIFMDLVYFRHFISLQGFYPSIHS